MDRHCKASEDVKVQSKGENDAHLKIWRINEQVFEGQIKGSMERKGHDFLLRGKERVKGRVNEPEREAKGLWMCGLTRYQCFRGREMKVMK